MVEEEGKIRRKLPNYGEYMTNILVLILHTQPFCDCPSKTDDKAFAPVSVYHRNEDDIF